MDDDDPRDMSARWIASGTALGLIYGLFVTCVAAALAALFLTAAFGDEGYGADEAAMGAWYLGLGLLMATAAVNCLYSAVVAFRRRRAGGPDRRRSGLAGEGEVFGALERGEGWAVALMALYGIVLLNAVAAALVVSESVTADSIFPLAVLTLVACGLILYARYRRRHPVRNKRRGRRG